MSSTNLVVSPMHQECFPGCVSMVMVSEALVGIVPGLTSLSLLAKTNRVGVWFCSIFSMSLVWFENHAESPVATTVGYRFMRLGRKWRTVLNNHFLPASPLIIP